MRKTLAILFSALFILIGTARADEGMWLPLLMGKYNIDDMRSKGFKLTAEDIYSINGSSIKDAIVIFGRGCTGELISPEGLLITNHHCGYGAIQQHSSVEHDYLTNGFWAMSREEELPTPGLTVSFLVKMEEVTARMLEGVTSQMTEVERAKQIAANEKEIAKAATEGTHYTSRIVPMYYGNEYYLYIYEVFEDVRMVGAPPSAIGKFGGDTDNWMWPRHTGDFSLFRIYANKDNQPAPYSPYNVPYKPKKFLPISMKGVNPGDFTMVYGYPGTTQQYITSHAVKYVAEVSDPQKVALRDIRLNIMNAYMDANDTVRIKYASKNAGVANAWKKWIGEMGGLRRLNAVERKQDLERQFAAWAAASPERTQMYGWLLPRFDSLYTALEPYAIARDYDREAVFAVELIRHAAGFKSLVSAFESGKSDAETLDKLKERVLRSAKSFYKDYYLPIDKQVFMAMMDEYFTKMPAEFHPDIYSEIQQKFNGHWGDFATEAFEKSIFADSSAVYKLLAEVNAQNVSTLSNDWVYRLMASFDSMFASKVDGNYAAINQQLDLMYRTYIRGLREMQPDKIFYPDANFTLRVAYGNVNGYEPFDGAQYLHYTTIEGIMEKDKPEIYDYNVPQRLRDLYKARDFGPYTVNGTVPVAFIATNHTSGGNSGSPVINGNGELIGVNFDRAWEGTMSDIMFDPDRCRNISIDIRYVLFIVDKFAGAGHLLNEMTIVK